MSSKPNEEEKPKFCCIDREQGNITCPHCKMKFPFILITPSGKRENAIKAILKQMAENGEAISSRTLAIRGKFEPRTARHWLEYFESLGLVARIKRTRSGVIYRYISEVPS